MTLAAMQIADMLEIDLTDAVLVQTSHTHGAKSLATDDRKLIQACRQVDLVPETPIDNVLRAQMASWETRNLPQKGLPRILKRIYHWLHQRNQQVSEEFWSQTGGGSHLP